jgi:hypothetical protein
MLNGFVEIAKAVLSHRDDRVDSLHAAGIVAMLSMIAIAAYQAYVRPDDFSPITYGTGASSIIAAVGGARRLRDGLADQGEVK